MISLGNGIYKNKKVPNIREFRAQKGFFTLPSWLNYQAPTGRTAIIGQGVMIRDIPANQPVGSLIPTSLFQNGNFALRLEPQATNYVLYSEDFSKWTNLHATVNGTGLTDPAGGSTAWDVSSASGYSGLITPTTMVYANPANPIICLSGWFLNAGPDPSNGLIAVLGTNGDMQVGYQGLPAYHQPPYNQTGWSRLWYIDQFYDYGVLYTEIGNRPEFQVFDTRAKYAFIQSENTAYPTSYIPTQGTPVTRSASILSWYPYKSDGTFDISLTFGMALSNYWQTGFTILSDSSGTKSIRMVSDGNHNASIQSIIGNTITDSTHIVWADSDNLTFHIVANGPQKKYTITVTGITVTGSGNPNFTYTFTAMHSAIFNFGSLIYIGSNPDGSNMIPVEGLISLTEIVF